MISGALLKELRRNSIKTQLRKAIEHDVNNIPAMVQLLLVSSCKYHIRKRHKFVMNSCILNRITDTVLSDRFRIRDISMSGKNTCIVDYIKTRRIINIDTKGIRCVSSKLWYMNTVTSIRDAINPLIHKFILLHYNSTVQPFIMIETINSKEEI